MISYPKEKLFGKKMLFIENENGEILSNGNFILRIQNWNYYIQIYT